MRGLAARIALAAVGLAALPGVLPDAERRFVSAKQAAADLNLALRNAGNSARDAADPFRGFGAAVPGRRRTPGTGWSVAQDRRKARKRRAVARNRRAHRG